MFCVNCGAKLPDGAKFCMNCGTKLPELQNGTNENPLTTKDIRHEEKTAIVYTQDESNYELNDDKLFHFKVLGREVCYSIADMDYANQFGKIDTVKEKICKEFDSFYNNSGNIDAVVRNIDNRFNKILNDITSKIYEDVVEDMYISKEELFEGISACFEEWNCISEQVKRSYIEIVDQKNAETNYRQARKASRGRMVGGGFGIGGAVKGMAVAGSINMATGLLHSSVNLIGNMGSSINASAKKSELYNNSRYVLRQALMNGIENLKYYYIKIYRVFRDEDAPVYTIEDKKRADSLYNAIVSGKIKNNRKDSILDLFEIYPFEDKYNMLLFSEYTWNELSKPEVIAWLHLLEHFIEIKYSRWKWDIFVALLGFEDILYAIPEIGENFMKCRLGEIESIEDFVEIANANESLKSAISNLKIFPSREYVQNLQNGRFDLDNERLIASYAFSPKRSEDYFIITNRNVYICDARKNSISIELSECDVYAGDEKAGIPYIVFMHSFSKKEFEVPVSKEISIDYLVEGVIAIKSLLCYASVFPKRNSIHDALVSLRDECQYYTFTENDMACLNEAIRNKITEQKQWTENLLEGKFEVLILESPEAGSVATQPLDELESVETKLAAESEAVETTPIVESETVNTESVNNAHLENNNEGNKEKRNNRIIEAVKKVQLMIPKDMKDYLFTPVNITEDNEKRLNGALNYAGQLQENEIPILCYDSTLIQSGKEGFLLTDQALYYFQKDCGIGRIPVEQITSIDTLPKILSPQIVFNKKVGIKVLLLGGMTEIDRIRNVFQYAVDVAKNEN